jgi:hypothetical protein
MTSPRPASFVRAHRLFTFVWDDGAERLQYDDHGGVEDVTYGAWCATLAYGPVYDPAGQAEANLPPLDSIDWG